MTELRKIEGRPTGHLFAEAHLGQDAGGWHCTRMRHEGSGFAYVKKHKWQNHKNKPYLTEWYKEVGG